MNKDKHIPQGYKESSLGIIPKEWEVKRLGDIAFVIGDGIHGTPIYTNDSDYFFINGNNLSNGKIFITNGTKCVPHSEYIKYKKDLRQNTILLSINGTIGNIALYNNEKIILGKSAAYISVPNYKFFYQLLQSNKVLIGFEKDLTGSTIRNLSLDSIRNTRIALPTHKEINKISDILECWDIAIEKQSELIEKLTLRKRALMQKLLTGKKRLPGFCAKWTKMKLGDIAEIVGGGTPNTNEPQYWDGDILWFTPSEIGKTKYVSKSERTISKEGLANSSAKKLPIGTILFTSRATIGAKAILEKEATTNQGFQSIIVSNGNSNEFLYYYIDILLNTIKQKASGSTFPEVSANSLRNLTIKMPEIEEQVQIASILIDSDKEIELANKKLAKLQSQKRGLMQQLLTGKKRIK